MKPANFVYHAPTTVAESVALLGRLGEEGRILAGGQSLVPLMNFRLAQPAHIVDINHVAELDFIRQESGYIAIGAGTRTWDIETSKLLASQAPLLVEAARLVAHPPIKHRSTIGGSLAHADPAAELPTAALALEATVVVASVNGTRQISIHELYRGPFETSLKTGELLTEVRVPISPAKTGYAFVEFSRRRGDFAIVGVAALIYLSAGRIDRAAIAMCGVAPTPVRARQAEHGLIGAAATDETITAAAAAAVSQLEPSSDIHGSRQYRIQLARVYVERAMRVAAQRARSVSE